MHRQKWLYTILAAMVLLACAQVFPANAQVIEERKGESNPGPVIFKAALYGAGTGLLVGGAWALVEDDDDLSTEEILKWSLAGGIVGGTLIGLIYVVARPEPKGDVEEVGSRDEDGARLVPVPGFRFAQTRDALGKRHPVVGVRVVQMSF